MSVFERILVFLGLAEEMEEEEYYDEDYQEEAENAVEPHELENETLSAATEKSKAETKKVDKKNDAVVPLRAAQNKVGKIYLMLPEEFDQAQQVGRFLKKGTPVIVNLKDLDKAVAKQFIDFISGTVFALDGTLHKISHQVFLFSPPHVTIEGQIDALEEVDLFDMDDSFIGE